MYYESVARIEKSNKALELIKGDYQQRVRDLQAKLVVEKTSTLSLPTISVQQVCKDGPFGMHFCLPEPKTVTQNVQQVTKTEDPSVRAELDATLEKLKKLSSENSQNQENTEALKSIYNFTHDMMKPIVSLAILLACIYIILSKRYTAEQEKWAFGSLGTIIGVWLKY